MATLSVGGTTVFDGSALQSGVTGSPVLTLPSTTTFPDGHVVQVVTNTYGTSVVSNTTTLIDTGLFCEITPSNNTNKILVMVGLSGLRKTGNTNFHIQLVRAANGSSNLTPVIHKASRWDLYTADSTEQRNGLSFHYLDSPGTASATNYKVVFASGEGVAGAQLQQSNADTVSVMTLMEISAS